MAERMAHDYGLPIVRLVDGSGGGGSVKTLETERRSFVPFNPGWEWVVANLGRVPVVSLCLGSVAGLGAARVVTSHYSADGQGHEPALRRRSAGREPARHRGGRQGDARRQRNPHPQRRGRRRGRRRSRRRSHAPARSSPTSRAASTSCRPAPSRTDDPERAEESLLHAIPRERRRVYQVRAILDAVVDRDATGQTSYFEIGRHWGRSAVTGLARIDGWPVAVLANDPYHYGGGWTADASRKVERFVDLAETFRLPVVHLVDNPGFVIGTQSEQQATIRHGARALAAIYQATVPWCSVIIRKVYGVAGAAHQNASRLSHRFAWPSGEWGSLPLEGGIEAAYKAQLEAADDPDALRAEIEHRLAKLARPVQDRRGVPRRRHRRPPGDTVTPLRVRRPRRAPPRPSPGAARPVRDPRDPPIPASTVRRSSSRWVTGGTVSATTAAESGHRSAPRPLVQRTSARLDPDDDVRWPPSLRRRRLAPGGGHDVFERGPRRPSRRTGPRSSTRGVGSTNLASPARRCRRADRPLGARGTTRSTRAGRTDRRRRGHRRRASCCCAGPSIRHRADVWGTSPCYQPVPRPLPGAVCPASRPASDRPPRSAPRSPRPASTNSSSTCRSRRRSLDRRGLTRMTAAPLPLIPPAPISSRSSVTGPVHHRRPRRR